MASSETAVPSTSESKDPINGTSTAETEAPASPPPPSVSAMSENVIRQVPFFGSFLRRPSSFGRCISVGRSDCLSFCVQISRSRSQNLNAKIPTFGGCLLPPARTRLQHPTTTTWRGSHGLISHRLNLLTQAFFLNLFQQLPLVCFWKKVFW